MEPNRKDKNGLSDKNLYILAARIIEYFENDKPYLDKSFSLDDLANHLDVPKHQLYTCLNTCLNKKFTQLRTSFRIEHAKKLLLSGDLDSKSLQGIWMEAGFSSKTNFFTTFKEETGLTPTEFILLEKNS
jgi:AraC-like DNA-binding protein